MPKVKTLKLEHDGREFLANLTVRSDGLFYAPNPLKGLEKDPEVAQEPARISGKTADEVEIEWKKRTRDVVDRKTISRKVILLDFDSTLRTGGKDFFTNSDATVHLKAAIAIETTLTVGEKTEVRFSHDPTYQGFRSPESPIPFGFRMRDRLNWGSERKTRTVVEWSQETEDLIVKACEGIAAVVEFFEKLTAEPLRIPEIAKTVAAGLPIFQALPEPSPEN